MMPDIETVIAENRRRLLRQVEGPLVRAVLADYQRVLRIIDARVAALSERVSRIIADGGDPASALLERRRLATLAEHVRTEVEAVTNRTGGRIDDARRVAIIASIRDVQGMANAMDIGVRLNTAAVERLVSAFSTESPLQASLSQLPKAAQQGVRDALVNGVTLGDNPRVVARNVSKVLGGNLNRALTLSRTEVMRAYRGASLDSYRRNSRVVEGWVWVSARDSRTCAVCFAMHGTTHDLDDPFASHASCRCSAAPLPATALPAARVQIPSGEQRFADLTVADQRAILGPAKLAAYQAGRIRLPDLVGIGDAGPWGAVRFERSLKSVLGVQAEQYYRRAA